MYHYSTNIDLAHEVDQTWTCTLPLSVDWSQEPSFFQLRGCCCLYALFFPFSLICSNASAVKDALIYQMPTVSVE